MLDIIRNKAQSFGIKLIFGAIILVFLFWGVGNMSTRSASNVAEVNGYAVSVKDFGRAFGGYLEAERARNPNFASDAKGVAELKQQVLDRMIFSLLWQQEAERLGLFVTPYELREVIGQIGLFQDAAGKFDKDKYLSMISARGMTPGQFETEQGRALLEEKLQRSIALSVSVTEAEAKNYFDFSFEERKAEYVLFAADDYKAKAVVSDEAVAAYYDTNKENFRTPALVNLSYLSLTPVTLAAGYTISDEEAAAYHKANEQLFATPERYHARHIFLRCPPEGSTEEGAAEKIASARALMDDITKQLKGGADFSTLAAKYSEDPNTAAKGGELGWLDKGTIPLQEFEDALAGMKAGETGAPVRSAFGLHLIRLIEKETASVKPLAAVKQEIKASLGAKKAEEDFKEVQKAAEDGLNLGTSLAELGAKFHVQVQKTGLIVEEDALRQVAVHSDSRRMLEDAVAGMALAPQTPALEKAQPAANGTSGAAASAPGVVSAQVKTVTIPVPLNIADGIALVAVQEVKPSLIRPLAEVKDAIVATLKGQEAIVLAHNAAGEALPAFTGNALPDAYKGKVKVSEGFNRVLPVVTPLGEAPGLAEALFSAPKGEWLAGAYDTKQGTVIIRVSDIKPAEEKDWEGLKSIFMQQYLQRKRQEVIAAFMQNLITRAKIEHRPEILEQLSLR